MQKQLKKLFYPDSVCVISGAARADSPAKRPLLHLLKHGFPGQLYGVNPDGEVPQGVIHCSTIDALPGPVDLALIVLGAKNVPQAVAACGRKGIKVAIVISAGFEELEEGKAFAEQLIEASKLGCAVIVGPNSEGVWSLPGKAVLSHGSAARREKIIDGPVSILSQSGSIGAACLSRVQDWGIGARFFVSVGNETVVSMLDYLEFIIEEGGTKVCALFVEGFKDAPRLRGLMRRAHQQGMRVVALKGGQTEEGRLATQSHTGKMSSAGDIYSSIFRQFGISEARDLREFFDLSALAASDTDITRLAADGRVGVVAFSGGCRALIADAMHNTGLGLAEFAEETVASLRALLPSFAYVRNPVDPSNVLLRNPQMLMSVLEPILQDEAVSALILQYPNWSEDQINEHIGYQLDQVATAMRQYGKPVIVSLLGMEVSTKFRAEFIRRGIGLARDPADSVRLLECVRKFARTGDDHVIESKIATHQPSAGPCTSWADQMHLLDRIGILAPNWIVVNEVADLCNALGKLRAPLAAKSAVTEVLHKSDLGLVKLNIANTTDAHNAFRDLQTKQPGAVLLQEMVAGAEILLSVIRDPDFGPILCLAKGGILVEHTEDRAYLACPVSADQVRDALQQARLMPLLSGLRGQKALDVDALVHAAVQLAAYFSQDQRFDAIEINPLIVGPVGSGAMAVDVVTISRSGQ